MKKLFSELSPAEVSWSISYVCIAWMGELGNGAIQTITGPMQPFLAYNLQTNTQTINLVWTLGFLGFLGRLGRLGLVSSTLVCCLAASLMSRKKKSRSSPCLLSLDRISPCPLPSPR